MTKPEIVIAIPTGHPLKDGNLPKKILRLAQEFRELSPDFEVIVSHTDSSSLPHAVNLLINEFRSNPLAQWFVWLDIKTEIEASQLLTLISSGKAAIGGLVSNCHKTPYWEASFYPDLQADEAGVLPIPELGVGVKIFHRTVFDAIEKHNPSLSYIYDHSGQSIIGFCQENLFVFGEYKRLLSASSHLDMLCRNAGIGVFAHTKVILKRNGPNGELSHKKEPYKPWMFKRLPPPVCVEDLPEAAADIRQIVVLIPHCDKDVEAANRLRDELLKQDIHAKLYHSTGSNYPSGPNLTASILLNSEWSNCKAILMLEPDCCPLIPDWLEQLSRDWDRCTAAGKFIMGSWHPINADHPTLGHINGNLMFSPDLAKRITIPDVPDDKPWDTFLADVFAPHWARTGLIKNLNRHKTATIKQLTEPECGTRPPVLIHGVKDDSAWNYAQRTIAS